MAALLKSILIVNFVSLKTFVLLIIQEKGGGAGMTEEEAIRILNPDADVVWKAYDGKDMERCNEACRLACIALAKQIPKKPIEKQLIGVSNDGYKYKGKCSVCLSPVRQITDKYCSQCGQALDWSEKEILKDLKVYEDKMEELEKRKQEKWDIRRAPRKSRNARSS